MSDLSKIEPPSCPVPTCCAPTTQRELELHNDTETRFHFSLNVGDLKRSAEFYEILFNIAPAKFHEDYAKFELTQPPLVFSLVPLAPATQGALSHLGLPVSSREEVHAAAERLEAAGLQIRCQDGTVCGWALQDKVWVADPDQNFWEIYVVHEEIEPRSCRPLRNPSNKVDTPDLSLSNLAVSVPDASNASGLEVGPRGVLQTVAPEQRILEHRVTDSFSCALNEVDESVDHFRLTGTFNAALSDIERHKLLREAFRVLRYGGEVSVHGLVSNLPAPPFPQLPGVASLVKRIPLEHEPISELKAAGFEQIVLVKLPQNPAFVQGDVQMREIKLAGRKPMRSSPEGDPRMVMYRGPFAQVVVESGRRFLRGEPAQLTAAEWATIAGGAAADCFILLDDSESNQQNCS